MTWQRYLAPNILALALLVPSFAADGGNNAEPLTKIPSSVSELRLMQDQVNAVYKKVVPAVVGIQIGQSSGSGVIISKDGYVLTAGHVSGKPDTKCTVIFPDGKRVNAKSLGANKQIDSGLIKITDEGEWPFVDMGDSTKLKKGQWCIAIGHPGGFYAGRSPVLRLGRIQNTNDMLVQTDCTLVGGDSGGPLFDFEGKVIGIHSRIGPSIAFNIHVPVTTYRETWDRLVKGETWGGNLIASRPEPAVKPMDLGARYNLIGGTLSVAEVKPGSLAEKAGLKVHDLIARIDGKAIASKNDIDNLLKAKKAGDELAIEVDRGVDKVTLKVKI